MTRRVLRLAFTVALLGTGCGASRALPPHDPPSPFPPEPNGCVRSPWWRMR